jgi:hypothetical protein
MRSGDIMELLINSEVTVGRLLRVLNREAVNALGRSDEEEARKAAALSKHVEEAMVFARLQND